MSSDQLQTYLALLEDAIMNRNVLLLEYRSPASGNRSERQIEPLGMCYAQDKWMLVAFCRLRAAQRKFRFDGFLSIKKTGDTFPPHQFTFNY